MSYQRLMSSHQDTILLSCDEQKELRKKLAKVSTSSCLFNQNDLSSEQIINIQKEINRIQQKTELSTYDRDVLDSIHRLTGTVS